jgi:hypothetical protein
MTIAEVISEAVRDFADKGFQSESQLNDWLGRLRAAIAANLRSPPAMEEAMRDALGAIFKRLVDKGQILRAHPSVSPFALARIAPRLRPELDRRILASANLIKLNRGQMIDKTLQRFAGWATSVPRGGSDAVDRREIRTEIFKPIAQESFEVRRVLVDQGHKLNANISAVIAIENNAIAAQWFSHFRDPSYNAREVHADRDRNGNVYLIRGSWAHKDGLVKVWASGYSDDIDQPSELPFCRCRYVYVYSLRQLDKLEPDMLTVKGRQTLEATRAA